MLGKKNVNYCLSHTKHSKKWTKKDNHYRMTVNRPMPLRPLRFRNPEKIK